MPLFILPVVTYDVAVGVAPSGSPTRVIDEEASAPVHSLVVKTSPLSGSTARSGHGARPSVFVTMVRRMAPVTGSRSTMRERWKSPSVFRSPA